MKLLAISAAAILLTSCKTVSVPHTSAMDDYSTPKAFLASRLSNEFFVDAVFNQNDDIIFNAFYNKVSPAILTRPYVNAKSYCEHHNGLWEPVDTKNITVFPEMNETIENGYLGSFNCSNNDNKSWSIFINPISSRPDKSQTRLAKLQVRIRDYLL